MFIQEFLENNKTLTSSQKQAIGYLFTETYKDFINEEIENIYIYKKDRPIIKFKDKTIIGIMPPIPS